MAKDRVTGGVQDRRKVLIQEGGETIQLKTLLSKIVDLLEINNKLLKEILD